MSLLTLARNRWLKDLLKITALGLFLLLAHSESNAQAQQSTIPPEVLAYADIVLYNGRVLTADRNDADFTVAEAVAVRDGKFLAVGTNQQIRRMAGPETRQIDLKGGTVTPGFIDTHQHLHEYAKRWLGPENRSRSLRFENLESGLQEIKAMADERAEGEWVVTSTRPYSARAMDRYKIDQVAPRNPVSVEISSEEFIINSLALERLLALIPPGTSGLIKDPKTGEPNGHLREYAAGVMQYEVLPYPELPIVKFKEILTKEMALETSWGLTTLMTRITSEATTAINELRQEGKLAMRWRLALQFPHLNPKAESYFRRLGNLDGLGSDMLKINGITFFSADSAIGRGGAWTHEPKKRELPGDLAGRYGVSREINFPLASLANRYGWKVKSIHSAGDRANTELLQAYLQTHEKDRPITGRGFGIDHGPMLTPEHIEVMKKIGAIPSIQMKYVFGNPENLILMYGPEAVHQMTPLKSLVDAGLKPAAGADVGEEPYGHPLWNIEKMVTRVDDKGRSWGSRERIDRKTALLTWTRWAARYSHEEDLLGSIEPGKLADFVVLDGDYLSVPESQIARLPVLMTVVGGKIVYDRQRDGEPRAPERRRPLRPDEM
ncbi:MAG: amidohydrolase family protein [Acidobacteria bacterium]|nr:amidohydrolase family protein [Acidobacteriota bacterium]